MSTTPTYAAVENDGHVWWWCHGLPREVFYADGILCTMAEDLRTTIRITDPDVADGWCGPCYTQADVDAARREGEAAGRKAAVDVIRPLVQAEYDRLVARSEEAPLGADKGAAAAALASFNLAGVLGNIDRVARGELTARGADGRKEQGT